MEININRIVKVKLTTYGAKILNDYYYELGFVSTNFHNESNFESELWQIMMIFGPHIHEGGLKNVFIDNIIDIK